MPASLKRLAVVAVAAVLLVLSWRAFAVEPVRRIGLTVEPYYAAAREPDGQPRVAVGKQYNDQLSSSRREDILAVRDRIVAAPKLVTPMTMMVLAVRLYDVGLRDDAVFWFYTAKERYIVLAEVLDVRHPGLAQVEDAIRNFSTLAGPIINGYAFCDLAEQKDQHAKAIAWVEANPYEAMFMTQLPAKPGDRAENHQRAITIVKDNAAKERAYFDNAKNAAAFYERRKLNEADAKFCWK